mgnify:CR=1 FL=1
MESLISVIIPLYNCEQYIEKCIKSILSQTYQNIEIIVVNDGSLDGSNRIMGQFVKKHSNIRYICQDNHGVAEARNVAIRKAKGKYILFVDADDYIDRNYVKNLVICAEKLNSEMVVSGFTVISKKGNRKLPVIPKSYTKIEDEIWVYRISAAWGRLYSKDFWDKYNLNFIHEDEARAEDVPIALFANAMANNIGIVNEAGYYYVQRVGSAMNNKEKKVKFLFPYIAFKKMYEQIAETTPNNSKIFYNLGVLKFLTQFEFGIYKYADSTEKERFAEYILTVIADDFLSMVSEWKLIRNKVELPILHKIAIQLFVIKYSILYKKRIIKGA